MSRRTSGGLRWSYQFTSRQVFLHIVCCTNTFKTSKILCQLLVRHSHSQRYIDIRSRQRSSLTMCTAISWTRTTHRYKSWFQIFATLPQNHIPLRSNSKLLLNDDEPRSPTPSATVQEDASPAGTRMLQSGLVLQPIENSERNKVYMLRLVRVWLHLQVFQI